jgi:hypothetical protein
MVRTPVFVYTLSERHLGVAFWFLDTHYRGSSCSGVDNYTLHVLKYKVYSLSDFWYHIMITSLGSWHHICNFQKHIFITQETLNATSYHLPPFPKPKKRLIMEEMEKNEVLYTQMLVVIMRSSRIGRSGSRWIVTLCKKGGLVPQEAKGWGKKKVDL